MSEIKKTKAWVTFPDDIIFPPSLSCMHFFKNKEDAIDMASYLDDYTVREIEVIE
jgi:hypothetical protein